MAYKYLNDDGLKAYTKKIKGALKDLHTPIAISSENTTESMGQNVRNIADFIAKAKAAGIADVNGMAVSCNIDNDYSAVLAFYDESDDNRNMFGVSVHDDTSEQFAIRVSYNGYYTETPLVTPQNTDIVTSEMLTRGARKPIILTPETTEVDEETYQKLMSDDVDVVYIANDGEYCQLTYKNEGTASNFYFTVLSTEGTTILDVWLYGYKVSINKTAPHEVTIDSLFGDEISTIIHDGGYILKDDIFPVLQEIDLTGTDAERKAKLDKFEADWKDLTGASDLTGARFVGYVDAEAALEKSVIFSYNIANDYWSGVNSSSDGITSVTINPYEGSLTITPLFSHLEPVEILFDNTAEKKKKNLDNLNAYKSNLEQLGVDTSIGFQVLFQNGNGEYFGNLYYTEGSHTYIGLIFTVDDSSVCWMRINADGEVVFVDLAVKAFGAIELKASDNAANKAALTAYKKILTDASISITNGYSVPVRITGNAQEYHGMLNIGTGALLSGIVTDTNETHHYPFNVSTTDGAIIFDANNYFLEKTSNEVTEMLDAIKYSYTPVPLTTTTSTNKTQLDLFLSKVPKAQVMHVTYKDVYAGTLHKINGSWYGVLVGESNTLAGQLSIKLQADGTIVEGTA